MQVNASHEGWFDDIAAQRSRREFVFPRRIASELFIRTALIVSRGRREGRVPTCTHGPRATKKHAAEPQVQADQPAFPAQWFYGLYVISPVTGLSCHRRRRDAKHHRQLDASVGAPGPYDFAVRDIVVRLRTRRVHRIPLPTFVTIAKRPSCGCGMTWMIVLIWGLRQCPSGCGTLARRAKSNSQLSPSPLRKAGAHNHRIKLFFDGGGSSLPNN